MKKTLLVISMFLLLFQIHTFAQTQFSIERMEQYNIILRQGEMQDFAPIVYDCADNVVSNANYTHEVKVADESIAEYKNGIITAKSVGTTIIKVYCGSSGSKHSIYGEYKVIVVGENSNGAIEEIYTENQDEKTQVITTVKNISDGETEALLVAAVYDNGHLEDVSIKNITMDAGEQKSFRLRLGENEAFGKIKCYLWEMDTMKPYSSGTYVAAQSVAAETMRIEGEAYSATSMSMKTIASSDLSGGELTYHLDKYNSDKNYMIVYQIECEKDGLYNLNAVTTKTNAQWAADYYVQVNKDSQMYGSRARCIEDVNTSKLIAGTLAKYDFGCCLLKKGKNIIKIGLPDKNKSGNNLSFYIDYLELIPAYESQYANLNSVNAPMAIFEDNRNVEFEMLFESLSKAEEYFYKVSDFYGNTVKEDKIVTSAGSSAMGISIPSQQRGWYKLTLTLDGAVVDEQAYGVVPALEKRFVGETPFALDNASSWLVGNYSDMTDYADAIKLFGVDWVRERSRWSEDEPLKGQFDFNIHKSNIKAVRKNNVNIINMFSDAPDWSTSNKLPTDPTDLYCYIKASADEFGSDIAAWELWNEEDAAYFSTETADRYAAVFKAGAIALADSKANPIKLFGGFSKNIFNGRYNELVMQNGIMDYADAYNYHTHIKYTGDSIHQMQKEQPTGNITAAKLYDKKEKPVWVTESGMQIMLNGQKEITGEQKYAQAKYMVTSNVTSLSKGTNKHFYFILPAYTESDGEFGLFDKDKNVYPAYVAGAFMTYILGEARYIGVLNDLPNNAEGYVLRNQSKEIAVVWTDEINEYYVNGADKAYNLMGQEIDITDGSILISSEPVYIVGDTGTFNITNVQHADKSMGRESFTPAEKIVIMPNPAQSDYSISKEYGYRLVSDGENTFSAKVYNFNEFAMSGTVDMTCEGDCDIALSSKPVTIEPMSYTDVYFTIKANENTISDVVYDLMIEGQFDSSKTSPAVSHVYFDYCSTDSPNSLFTNSRDKNQWQSNLSGGSVSTSYDSDSICFRANLTGTDKWCYPLLQLTTEDRNFGMLDGIMFDIYFDEDIADLENNSINVFVYTDDGNRYFMGTDVFKICGGWNKYGFKWSRFKEYGGSQSLDASKITAIAIGANTDRDDVMFKLKEVGVFESKGELTKPEIIITGIENGQIISSMNAQILLPEGTDYASARLVLNDVEAKCHVEGNRLFLDESLADGFYQMTAVAYTDTGLAIYKQIEFFVETDGVEMAKQMLRQKGVSVANQYEFGW